MPVLHVMEECFVAAPPVSVAALVAQPHRWSGWWPGLTLRVREDRGAAGLRWSVGGELTGSAEIWVEPHADGAVVHYYLRAEPTSDRRRRVWKRRAVPMLWAIKDELEAGRRPGEPSIGGPDTPGWPSTASGCGPAR